MTDITSPHITVGLDREAKQKIRIWVLKLRHVLEDDIRTQLRRVGIAAGKTMAKDAPAYLTPEEKAARQVIVAAICRDAQNERSGDDALAAYVRECVHTLLNRLVGLKCMEARSILYIHGESNEVVTTRPEYGDRSRLLWQMREEDREYRSDETRLWQEGLTRAFRAVTEDIAVLFDPTSEWSQVWPSQGVLRGVIRDINGLDAVCGRDGQPSVFASPDFLGWVYQFFNVEEKEEIREATKGKPRTSHELAVINQFYTPDWIVKFLVDNTLGRVWLRMHPDTRLRSHISYLVPKTGEDESAPLKAARDLKLLDPACGTMHMGQYAYGLFYEMYLEEQERAGSPGWPSEPSVAAPEDIPAAILAHNLHGIDIDPRAIQIAALTLLLTMKEQAQAHGLDPQCVRVQRMNLVCADAVNLGDAEQEEFIRSLDPTVFGGTEPLRRAVKAVWEGLKHVAELGSLVQVGEEVERALESPITYRLHAFGPEQISLDAGEDWGLTQRRLTEEERATAREQLEDALADYTRQHLSAVDINRRLFAQETGKAMHLLDLLRQKYDVIVMNPPFGHPSNNASKKLNIAYPSWSGNILCAFGFKARDMINIQSGYIGFVADKSVTVRNRYEPFRKDLLLERAPLLSFLDAGWGALDDANVEVCAFVLDCNEKISGKNVVAFRCIGNEGNSTGMENRLRAVREEKADKDVFFKSLRSFDALPNTVIAYSIPDCLADQFGKFSALDPNFASVRVGVTPQNADRFYRQHWEVELCEIGAGCKWVMVANGGPFSPYYRCFDQIIYFDNNGEELKNYISVNGYSSSYRSPDFQMTGGLTYSKRTHLFNVQVLPTKYIFTDEGQGIFDTKTDSWSLLAILNTKVVRALINSFCGQHKHSGYVKFIPVPESGDSELSIGAQKIHNLKAKWDEGNEICTHFTKPWLLQAMEQRRDWKTLGTLLDECLACEQTGNIVCQRLQDEIDTAVYDLYEISPEDRPLIERELGEHPKETVWPQMDGKSIGQKRVEHVYRLLSWLVKTSVEEDEDGIVPLVSCGGETSLATRIRERLEILFSPELVSAVESDINNLLGKRVNIETWLAKSYFKFHIGLYERRPIYWHIASDDGSFGAIIHYHRFSYDRIQKLRSVYLYDFQQRCLSEIGPLYGDQRVEARTRLAQLETNLESARALDEKLRQIQEGESPICVPWKADADQPKGWRPDIDDGIKVNIGPFEKAGVLAMKKVV